ncbi:MAG TPA: hypothetical protein VGG85_17115 [Terracidiphilus sp.]|jgi:hypothetical protein
MNGQFARQTTGSLVLTVLLLLCPIANTKESRVPLDFIGGAAVRCGEIPAFLTGLKGARLAEDSLIPEKTLLFDQGAFAHLSIPLQMFLYEHECEHFLMNHFDLGYKEPGALVEPDRKRSAWDAYRIRKESGLYRESSEDREDGSRSSYPALEMSADREAIRIIREKGLLTTDEIEQLMAAVALERFSLHDYGTGQGRASWLTNCYKTQNEDCTSTSQAQEASVLHQPEHFSGHSSTDITEVESTLSRRLSEARQDYEDGKKQLGLLGHLGLMNTPHLERVQSSPHDRLNREQELFLKSTLMDAQKMLGDIGLRGLADFVQQRQAVLAEQADKSRAVWLVDSVFSVLAKASTNIAVDVVVVSNPVKLAQLTLKTIDGHVELQTITDSITIHNVYRGIYQYELIRDNWKGRSNSEINLIDRIGTRITCTLQSSKSELQSACEAN